MEIGVGKSFDISYIQEYLGEQEEEQDHNRHAHQSGEEEPYLDLRQGRNQGLTWGKTGAVN